MPIVVTLTGHRCPRARAIRRRLRGHEPDPIRSHDKGNLATIGRSKGVADITGIHLAGFTAWTLCLLAHLDYLIGLQNRLLLVLRWTFSVLTRGRGARLIVDRAASTNAHPAVRAALAPRGVPSTTSDRRGDESRMAVASNR